MANAIYNEYKGKIPTINWADNTNVAIKVMLVTDQYTLDIDAHENKDDIDALNVEVADGDGYTSGGAAVTNRTITVDDTNDVAKFDADDVTWSNSTITARGAIVYYDTGTASTSTLIAYIDFGENKSSSNGDFVIQWSVDGVYKIG